MPERDILFKRCSKMYVMDFDALGMVLATQAYTKAEVQRMQQVMELIRMCGYPSFTELAFMLRDGNIMILPNLMAEDVRRANELYGKTAEFIRGRMTHKKVSRAIVEDDLVLKERQLILYTDIMHVDGQWFVITVCNPMKITLQVHIEQELQNVLGLALQGQLNLLRSKGFTPTCVYVEQQSALRTLFETVSVDIGNAGDFMPKVEKYGESKKGTGVLR
jgi:hypothetical protein